MLSSFYSDTLSGGAVVSFNTNSRFLDLHLFTGLTRATTHRFKHVERLFTCNNFTEDCVFTIKVLRWHKCDKKLAAIGAWSCICHT